MNDIITADRAIEMLTKAVEERGSDYVYPHYNSHPEKWIIPEGMAATCRYVDPETGHGLCGVGVVFEQVMTPRAWESISEKERLGSSPGDARSVVEASELPITQLAAGVLNAFQIQQDAGRIWGYALQTAINFLADAREDGRGRPGLKDTLPMNTALAL